MNAMRPLIGAEILLVYRECACGEWCATGEGAMAPRCGHCGEQMWPAGTAVRDGVPQFGPEDDPHEQRRLRGLGFRGALANEIALATGKPLSEAVAKARMAHGRMYEPEPYLTDMERRVRS